MLVTASGPTQPGFFLFTLGSSCHYLLDTSTENEEAAAILFDPGLSVHIAPLLERIQTAGVRLELISEVFITHLHPERMGGLPLLRRINPNIRVLGSSPMQVKLADHGFAREIYDQDQLLSNRYPKAAGFESMDFEEYRELLRLDYTFPESDLFPLAPDITLRCMACPGHTSESVVYLLSPYNFLIVDEGFGYFRGRSLAAPGGDSDLEQSLNSTAKFKDIDIAALCFPNTGLITGNLIRRHLDQLEQNTRDLISETHSAFSDGIEAVDIRSSIEDAFYVTQSADPLLSVSLKRSFDAVWTQMSEKD